MGSHFLFVFSVSYGLGFLFAFSVRYAFASFVGAFGVGYGFAFSLRVFGKIWAPVSLRIFGKLWFRIFSVSFRYVRRVCMLPSLSPNLADVSHLSADGFQVACVIRGHQASVRIRACELAEPSAGRRNRMWTTHSIRRRISITNTRATLHMSAGLGR